MPKPPLWDLVNSLYHAVADKPELNALVLGASGAYLVVRTLQLGSKHVMDRIIPGFDDKALPFLETTCIIGWTLTPVLYEAIHPGSLKSYCTPHPVYMTSMMGAYFGSVVPATVDLIKRFRKS
ncbi:MAG: hypothetical protein V1743_06230 [Nanoarchaeota archaeon]